MRRRASGEREPAAVNAPSARELALAEQLAATGDILRIVSTMGPGSRVEPVLEAIVATAARLCGAEFALAYVRKEDGLYHTVAANRADAELVRYAVEHPLSPGPGSLIARATLEGGPVHVEDCLADPDYAYPEFQRIGGFRTMLGVPLMRDGLAVGALGLLRSTVSPFSQAQIELVTTFADQAVIAIENVRLFQEVRARTDELGEALRQQTATADVLKVISRSTFNLEAVLDTLVESATRLCDADHSWLFLRDGNFFRWAASFGHGTEVHERIKAYFKPLEVPVDRGSITGRAALEGRLVHVPDVLADPDYTWSEAQHIGGYRAAIGVPLFREGTVIGVIFVAKCLPEPFSANQMELVTTFADQAVIAIENVRLFDEVQARTRELEEALEYQTATGDVLNVISRSPAQIQPVLDTIVETARRLCEAYDAVILLREGDYLSVASHRGPIPVDFAKWPISRGWVTGRAIVDGKPMHVADLEAAAEEFPDGHAMALRQGHRTLLATPLLREDVAIGAIVIRRTEVRPFSEKQIAVLQTFADQAVIAIENARLFEEVQTRTAELTEALEQQTATSEVLQVISRSAFDLQTVLDTLVQSAARLGDADIGTITRQRDGSFFREALYGFSDEFSEYVRAIPVRPEKGNISGRALLEGKIVQIEDVERDPDYTWDEAKRTGRYRTLLGVPLVRHGKPIGVMALGRREVRPFNQREIDLVTTFADQAVIAIENVRLFDEVQARTRDLEELLQQQTATAEVLKVISRSTFELQPVLDTLVESAARLCEADMAAVARQTGTAFHYAATFGYSPELKAYLVGIPHTPGRGSIIGRTLGRGQHRSRRRRPGGPELPHARRPGEGRLPHRSVRAVAARAHPDRRRRADAPCGAAFHGQADRARHDLRRPGGDRDRERAPVRRSPGKNGRAREVRRRAAGARRGQPSRQLDPGPPDRPQDDRRQGGATLGDGRGRDLRFQQAASEVSPARHLRHERCDDRGDRQARRRSAWRIVHRGRGRERPGRASAGSHDRARLADARPHPERRLSRAPGRSAPETRRNRRRAGGSPQGTGCVSGLDDRSPPDFCRLNPSSRSRTCACSRKSRREPGNWRNRSRISEPRRIG